MYTYYHKLSGIVTAHHNLVLDISYLLRKLVGIVKRFPMHMQVSALGPHRSQPIGPAGTLARV